MYFGLYTEGMGHHFRRFPQRFDLTIGSAADKHKYGYGRNKENDKYLR